ncbi:hypothetical protein HN51_004066 [Arachis hypogaea]|nr:polyadenylate-binding protein, cytoplasmic and nuclear-like [Arachis hypogaea]
MEAEEGWQRQGSRRRRRLGGTKVEVKDKWVGDQKDKWENIKRNSHSVFIDNLPWEISKGTLFKAFGWVGAVTDIYISRKKRRGIASPFAFVRFDAKGRAERAVQKLNGVCIGSKRMTVTHACFTRGLRRQKEQQGVWRSKKKTDIDNVRRCKEIAHNQESLSVAIKEKSDEEQIEVKISSTQAEMLKRSIVGENSKPIVFSKMMKSIREKWEGPGRVECRDVGPFKCLLTFESKEYMQVALKSEALTGLVDELKPHNGMVWNATRRIWLEVIGVPI